MITAAIQRARSQPVLAVSARGENRIAEPTIDMIHTLAVLLGVISYHPHFVRKAIPSTPTRKFARFLGVRCGGAGLVELPCSVAAAAQAVAAGSQPGWGWAVVAALLASAATSLCTK